MHLSIRHFGIKLVRYTYTAAVLITCFGNSIGYNSSVVLKRPTSCTELDLRFTQCYSNNLGLHVGRRYRNTIRAHRILPRGGAGLGIWGPGAMPGRVSRERSTPEAEAKCDISVQFSTFSCRK